MYSQEIDLSAIQQYNPQNQGASNNTPVESQSQFPPDVSDLFIDPSLLTTNTPASSGVSLPMRSHPPQQRDLPAVAPETQQPMDLPAVAESNLQQPESSAGEPSEPEKLQQLEMVRDYLGINQQEFLRRLGRSQSTISNWKNRKKIPLAEWEELKLKTIAHPYTQTPHNLGELFNRAAKGSLLSFDFADTLKRIMENNKITREELASALGVHNQTISKWRNNKRTPMSQEWKKHREKKILKANNESLGKLFNQEYREKPSSSATAAEAESDLQQPEAESLATATGYEQIYVRGDGNCLFNAIAAGLERFGTSYNPSILRQMAIDNIRSNPDYFRDFMIPNTELFHNAANLEEYLEKMEKQGIWGGDLESTALTHALGRPILIHLENHVNVVPGAINLILVNGNHFDLLVPRSAESNPQQP